jgi:hypothetical protein
MTKRIIILVLMIGFFLIVTACLAISLFIPEKDFRSPGRIGSYPNSGMYTFDPDTIFETLEQGEIDVFTPYFESPDETELYYDTITWSQSDYLTVANTLSQKIWGKSLKSTNWNIESVYFAQDCNDNPKGFNRFYIVYYEDLGVANWKRNYTTRLIDLEPWRGLAYWGEDAIFSSSLLSRWKNIGLEDFAISADDALQMAEEHGGNETEKSHCSTISVSMYQHDNEVWDVNYSAANFGMYIDANSGKYKLLDN